jgi:hypothetical protein
MSDNTLVAPLDPAASAAPAVTGTISPAPVSAPMPSDSSAAASAQPIQAADPAPIQAPSPAPSPAAKPELAPSGSLLSDQPKPADPAPAVDPAKPADAPAADAKPADAPAEPAPAEPLPAPTYEFKFPEDVTVDQERVAKMSELIGSLELDAKLDHGKASEFGQKALDFHLSEMQRVVSEIDQQGRAAWTDMREGWRNTFKSDPELGGNRQQTTLAACTRVIDQFGGSEQQRAELRQILGTTGAGDHPALIRLLANVGKQLGEGRPVPAVVPKSPVVPSRKERRYHASNGAA